MPPPQSSIASPYAKPGPYITTLPADQETGFQDWVKQNSIPFDPSPNADYDMRGYYKDNVAGAGGVKTKVSAFDGRPHFPDTYKTPYHKTFSNESRYALPNAPHWKGDTLVDWKGNIVADETPKQNSAPDFIPVEATAPDFIPATTTTGAANPEPNSSSTALFGARGQEAPAGFFTRLRQSLAIPWGADELKPASEGMDLVHSTTHPVLAHIANAVLGPAGAGAATAKAYGQNLYNRAVEPMTPAESANMQAHPVLEGANQAVKYLLRGPLAPVGGEAINSFAQDLGGHMDAQPGHPIKAALHGDVGGDVAGSLLNLLLMRGAAGPTAEGRLNSLTAAGGAKTSLPFERLAQPLLETADATGTRPHSVQDVLDVVNKFKDRVNGEYGNAIGPHANTQLFPQQVSQRILDLITPDMQYTAEGRAEIAEIRRAATEYQQPWTLGALDSRRSRLAADLASHNAKEPVARYTAERGSTKLAIDNTIMDALRDTVYPQADTLAGKPAGYFENLKRQQSDAIRLQSLLNRRIEDLVGKSREAKGQPAMSRMRPGAAVSGEGAHGYFSNIPNVLFPRDVLASADKAAARGLGTGGAVATAARPISKALVMSYPARFLALPPMTADPNAPPQ